MTASQELTTGREGTRINDQRNHKSFYYRGAQACVLAFSCVDRESFKQVGRWKRKVEEECGNIPMVLVMTKMDLLYKAAIDSFEVEKMSRNLGLPLIKTSVKENLNVTKVNFLLTKD